MKLLHCKDCEDLLRLMLWSRKCMCGSTGGRYINDRDVRVYGNCSVIGINSDELQKAESDKMHGNIPLWVIPENCMSIKRLGYLDKIEECT